MSTLFYPDLPGFSYGAKRTQNWKGLLVQTSASQIESRMQQQSMPKWEWDCPYNYLRLYGTFVEFQTLAGFYAQTFGGLLSFFYRDENDNSVIGQPIGTGGGGVTQFQLQRNIGGFNELIYAVDTRPSAQYGYYTRPAATAFQAFVNGSPASATVNTSTGIVTFASAPATGAALTANFSFLFRVRFEDTNLDFSTLFKQCYDAKSVKLLQCAT